MDDFKFFDDYDPLPELTPLDRFCLAMCAITGVTALVVFATELFR